MKLNRLNFKFQFNFQYYFNSKLFLSQLHPKQKFAFTISQPIEDGFLRGDFKAKHHPGINRVDSVYLPTRLLNNIEKIKNERSYPEQKMLADAEKLEKQLWSRQPPYEEEEMRDALHQATSRLVSAGELGPDFTNKNDSVSFEDLSGPEKRKLKNTIKQYIYNWSPEEFNEYSAFVYMWTRLAPDYAALVKIFTELKRRRSDFAPRSLFDFGSGVGSVSWAVNSVWPGDCKETYNVDKSASMNELSELLREGTCEKRSESIANTYYRQFLPASDNLKFNLVVSSRSFFDVGDLKSRIKTVDVLWRKVLPGGFLVIVEAGTKSGHSVVLSLRDYIMEICKIEREKFGLESPVHVVSPCPHDSICPRANHPSRTACSFVVPYFGPSSPATRVDKFSYVVLQKSERPEGQLYPRVVQPTIKNRMHVISRVCTPQGDLQELVTTKRRHGSPCYQMNRQTSWGDFLPVILPEKKNLQNIGFNVDATEISDHAENR